MPVSDRLILTRLEQVRALADPQRLRLVELLVAQELSVAGLARKLEVPATRLYHHVDILHDSGLIAITRRVKRRGGEERYYRAVARKYQLDDSLLAFSGSADGLSTDELVELARAVLGSALEEVTHGLRNGRVKPGGPGSGLMLEDRELRLSAAGRAALARELPAWLDEFARRHGSPRGAKYRVALAGFPAVGANKRKTSGR